MKITVKLAIVVLLSSAMNISCGRGSDNKFAVHSDSAPPALDHSTPDRLIKSVWTYSAWLSTLVPDSTIFQPFLSHRARNAVLASMKNRAEESSKAVTSYEILRVTSESESRATVLAWEDKDSIVYVLANDGKGWFVDDRQQKCWNCSGTGQETDYQAWKSNSYSSAIPKKECSKCLGSGRLSSYYSIK